MTESFSEINVKIDKLISLYVCIQVAYNAKKNMDYAYFFLLKCFFLKNSKFHYFHIEEIDNFFVKY